MVSTASQFKLASAARRVARPTTPALTPSDSAIARCDRPSSHFWRRISHVSRIDSLSVGIGPGDPGRGLPPQLRALRAAARHQPGQAGHDADPSDHHGDLGDHDGDPGDHDAPILAITMRRSNRSRWPEIRSHAPSEHSRRDDTAGGARQLWSGGPGSTDRSRRPGGGRFRAPSSALASTFAAPTVNRSSTWLASRAGGGTEATVGRAVRSPSAASRDGHPTQCKLRLI